MKLSYRLATCLWTCALLSSCASLENELRFTAENLGSYQARGRAMGVEVEKEHYFKARYLWPWAHGESLHRRAMILVLNPGHSDLERLSRSSGEAIELATLGRLISDRR